ncbi:hypothetical protein NP493_5287g00001 [Ridgeia piscesae]|uniref:Uncharacterized protein n=1 Tax=Ridgeia piscesae TaxID=27915 RepID=A0AAD9MRP6_RIDPI|nr:hypothetical protein NP493_5287g00001 [Ridgeia piscesae]
MSFTLDVFTISFFSGTFFISFSSPTFIIYLSLYLILYLSLLFISLPRSLQPRSLSLFRHVNHPVSFSRSLSRSHQPPSPTLLSSVLDATSLSFSLPLYLSSATLTVTFPLYMYTIALSFFPRSRFSLHAAMLTSFILFCCGPHLSLSLSLFSHTHPLYSLLLGIQPLCLYL